jgi:hypothetical protein
MSLDEETAGYHAERGAVQTYRNRNLTSDSIVRTRRHATVWRVFFELLARYPSNKRLEDTEQGWEGDRTDPIEARSS